MYRCESCGHLFEQGEEKIESSYLADYGSEQIFETHFSCPVCGGDFEEVNACKLCRGYHHIKSGEKYCEACKTYTKSKFQMVLKMNFNECEKELLNDLYDGEEF